MAKKSNTIKKAVDMDLVADALAKSICDGDIVNFRLLFASFSPARKGSTQALDDDKYAYLLPDEDMRESAVFEEARRAVRAEATWRHIEQELQANRPAQVPSELLLPLADNAVREGKYSAAAQAYELLRIRRGMQEEILRQADQALDEGDIPRGVRAYRIAVGLSYDYAAFPEPLPAVPNYQTRALMLHGVYPTRPEDCVALQSAETHASTAIDYLLQDEEIASRLRSRPLELQLDIFQELVKQIDPDWSGFISRYAEACRLTQAYGEHLRQMAEPHAETLEEEIEEQRAASPLQIMATLLGREIENGTWWQYLKELAFAHPAAVLFVSRQILGENEVVMPRLLANSVVPKSLGLEAPKGIQVSTADPSSSEGHP